MKYNKSNKDSIKKDDKKDNFLINLGKTLKNTTGFAVETANNFGTNLPFDLLRDFGVPIKETVFTPTAYNKKDYINMSVKDFIPNLLEGSANLVTGVLTDGLVNKGMSKASNFVSNKLKLLKNAKKVVNPVSPVSPANTQTIKVPQKQFKSEINWGKWNEEIPNNSKLMKEYNAIEKASKANGTWMKNPDGSAFRGTPEQFIQQNSENFKKAFGNTSYIDKYGNPEINYHGGKSGIEEFKNIKDIPNYKSTSSGVSNEKAKDLMGIYFTSDKSLGKQYARGSKSGERNLYEVYLNSENPYKENKFGLLRLRKALDKDFIDPQMITTKDVDKLQKLGYDSFNWLNAEHVMFDPTKIKSAVGNNGMFDMTNPNIYKVLIPAALMTGYLKSKTNEDEKTVHKTKQDELTKHYNGGKLNNHTNMNKDLKDHGPKPFVVDVEKLTEDNKNYRTVIWTGKYMQMTVMSIPPGEDIGLEIHKDHDQFIRIEKGKGIVQMGDAEDNLDFQEKVGDDFAILIPAGKWHNLVNNSTEPLKLYSIYSPVEHPKNTVHKTKQGEVTKHFSGGTLESIRRIIRNVNNK